MVNRDFSDLLSTFNDHDVRYLIVGGYAVSFHSKPRFTKDLDVWIEPEQENAERAWNALAGFGAPLDGVSTRDLATPGIVFQVGMPPNRVDVLTSVVGVAFDDAWPRRVSGTYGDVEVAFLSREDLITNKRKLGRLQDLVDAENLESHDPGSFEE